MHAISRLNLLQPEQHPASRETAITFSTAEGYSFTLEGPFIVVRWAKGGGLGAREGSGIPSAELLLVGFANVRSLNGVETGAPSAPPPAKKRAKR